MSYVVTAPLVVTRRDNGTDLYLYEGAPVPDEVSADECKRLAEAGLISDSNSDKAKSSAARSSSK